MKSPLLQFKSRQALYVLALCLTALTNLKAQTAPAWVQFGSPANYSNYNVKEVSVGVDTLGNVYTAASMYDTINNLGKTVLMKYNSAGTQQWAKFFDAANQVSNDKYAVALLVDKAGNSYLCGYGYTNGGSTSIDYLVVKYDQNGNQQWVKTFDGGQSDWDFITCATFDAAGNIVVAGYVNNNGGTNGDDIAVVKYSTSGAQLWSYIYNNSAHNYEDRALGIASDGAGNIFITGSTYETNARSMITLKLNSAGLSQWIKIVPHVSSGDDERGYSIAADAVGNCYATGAAGDWITVKYDASGTVLWTNHYTAYGLNSDNLKKVMLDKNNDVIIAGDAFVGSANGSDLSVSKLSGTSGTSMWNLTKNNNSTDRFTDAVLDNAGNVYIGGYFSGTQGTDISGLIVSPAGLPLWNGTYSNPVMASGDDRPYHVAVDKGHNFYLAGLAERRGTSSDLGIDIVTLRYDALITGLKENTAASSHLSVYPNPAKDQLNLHVEGQEFRNACIFLCSISGEILKQEKLQSPDVQVDIQQLPAGIYLVKVIGAQSMAIGKFIKE